MTNELPQASLSEFEEDSEPWKDEATLRELYHGEKLSYAETADELGCSVGTVRYWMDKYDIETRDISTAKRIQTARGPPPNLIVDQTGYEAWWHVNKRVYVHRLAAVAEYGYDAVTGMHVHHKNGVRWDNRPENLELITNSEHQRKHLKVGGLDRIRVAELYENGDISAYNLIETLDYDIQESAIYYIHDEFYGDAS